MGGKGGGKESKNTPSINSCLHPWDYLSVLPKVKRNYVSPLSVTYRSKVKPQLILTGQQSAVKLQLIMIKMANECDSLLFNDF